MTVPARSGKPHSTPLLPQHGIVVQGPATPRFVRLFRKTWAMIPLAVRRAILKHWRGGEWEIRRIERKQRRKNQKAWEQFLASCPAVVRANILAATRPSERTNVRRKRSWPTIRVNAKPTPRRWAGSVSYCGHVVKFWVYSITRRTEANVCHLIAHELAHVYQYAIGTIDGMTYDGAEADAERLAKAWTKGGAK